MPILIYRTARLISYQTRCSFATFCPPLSRVHALLFSPLCQKYICLASACDVVFGTPHRISFLVSSILRLIRETATSWAIACPEVRKKAPLRYGDQSIIRIACPRRQNRLQVMPTSSECRPSHQAFVSSYLVGSRVKASNRSCHRTHLYSFDVCL